MNETPNNAARLAAIPEAGNATALANSAPSTTPKKKWEMYPQGYCIRCRKKAQDGSRWCYECGVNAPRCRQCNEYPAGFFGNTRSPKCLNCVDEANKKPSKAKLDEIREQKRVEMIERGELCYRCGRGTPDPGHKLCYGCEQATAKRPAKKSLGRMPESCMYGWLGEFARKLDSPLDAAYPVALAVAAGYGVPDYKRLRPNLYVNIIGGAGDGKSRVIDRTLESWQPPTKMQVVRKYPGSEVGLVQLLGGKKAKEMRAEDHYATPYLLAQDEMRITFNKMDIQGSSLPNMLNEMFYKDDFGSATAKNGQWQCVAKLSLVGGLTCDGPDQFAEIYGAATTHGTFDRTLFGIMPDDWEFDDMWEPPIESPGTDITDNLPIQRRARASGIPAWAFDKVKEWRRGDFANRKRLGELALRVALVTSSLNHDPEVTEDCLRAALEFAEWQEQIRKEFAPSETDDLDGRAEQAIIRALEKQTDWVEWRTLCQRYNLHRAAKSRVRLNRVKKALIWEEIIEEEYETQADGKDSKERTGRVRLKP